jgi:hypothetical protein
MATHFFYNVYYVSVRQNRYKINVILKKIQL